MRTYSLSFFKYLFLLAVICIPFSTFSLILMALCGFFALFFQSSISIRALCRLPSFIFFSVFFLLALLHAEPMVGWHGNLKALSHWVLYFFLMLAALLFTKAKDRQLLRTALLIAGSLCIAAFVFVLYLPHGAGHPWLHHLALSHWVHLETRTRIQCRAVFLALCAALSLHASLSQYKQASRINRNTCLYFLAFLIATLVCFSQVERVGYLTWFALMFYLFCVYFTVRQVFMVGLSCVVLIGACYHYSFPRIFRFRVDALVHDLRQYDYSKPAGQSANSDGEARIDGYREGSAKVVQSPWWGYGLASFRYDNKSQHAQVLPTGFVENSFLLNALEFGLPGLLLYLAFLYSLCALSRGSTMYARVEMRCMLLALCLGACTSEVLHTSFGLSMLGVMMALVVGQALSSERLENKPCQTVFNESLA